jgi:hypothetical protein
MTSAMPSNHISARTRTEADVTVTTIPETAGLAELRIWCDAIVAAGLAGKEPACWGAYLAPAGKDGLVAVRLGRHNHEPVRRAHPQIYAHARKIRAARADAAMAAEFDAPAPHEAGPAQ